MNNLSIKKGFWIIVLLNFNALCAKYVPKIDGLIKKKTFKIDQIIYTTQSLKP